MSHAIASSRWSHRHVAGGELIPRYPLATDAPDPEGNFVVIGGMLGECQAEIDSARFSLTPPFHFVP
jgi:hypothetical protein